MFGKFLGLLMAILVVLSGLVGIATIIVATVVYDLTVIGLALTNLSLSGSVITIAIGMVMLHAWEHNNS